MLLKQKIKKRGILTLLFGLLMSTSYGQVVDHPLGIKHRASILHGAVPEPFYKIPELKAECGELKVDLYINEMMYNFEGDTVKLRTYTYESGEFHSTRIGPWGPTLRVGKSDRLSVTIHNNLPDVEDMNYLGSFPLNAQNLIENYSDSLTKAKLDTVFAEVTNYESRADTAFNTDEKYYAASLLSFGNTDGAYIEEVTANEEWILRGRVPCPCPEGEPKSCTKVYIDYKIIKAWNYGTHEYAYRIYEIINHGASVDHNVPHDFSVTNLHAHGFHVDPAQDDVLRTVNPSYSSYYTYDLDKHTPGTMWYHPHIHGSTALQVGSGMSGAIIIEDEFEKGKDGKAFEAASSAEHERLLVFNQITFDSTINESPDFNTLQRSIAPNGTTVNGVSIPIIDLKVGEVQRWRLLHSGYKSNLALVFPEELEVQQIAVDGILFNDAVPTSYIHMSPGNRCDILVKLKDGYDPSKKKLTVKSAVYEARCEYFHDGKSLCDSIPPDLDSVIVVIRVNGKEKKEMEFPSTLPGPGGELTHDIAKSELTNPSYSRKIEFDVSNHSVNGVPFQGDTIPQILTLGEVERWELSSTNTVRHPYHIHINPFQVITFGGEKLPFPMWKDVVLVDATDTAVIYTRYEDFVGDFVLHCHILNHEDEGMMQRVRIVKPLVECPIENEINIVEDGHDKTHGRDVDPNQIKKD